MTAFLNGLTVGFSLILAIGSQNAYVLRQGLRNEHVLAICLVCALSDAILISFGVAGFQTIVLQEPWLIPTAKYLGTGFLILYGTRCFMSAWRGETALQLASYTPRAMVAAVGTSMALTWLNPHVYLDTLFLIGSISTNFPGMEVEFAAGSITASFSLFFLLGYGSRFLRPLLVSAKAWRVLDFLIGTTMWALALTLSTS